MVHFWEQKARSFIVKEKARTSENPKSTAPQHPNRIEPTETTPKSFYQLFPNIQKVM